MIDSVIVYYAIITLPVMVYYRSSLLAYLCIYQLPQLCSLPAYPAFGPASQFQTGWILHILARYLKLQFHKIFAGL